jgi:magnesium transporter
MVEILYFPKDKPIQENVPLERLGAALRDRSGLVWVDLAEEDPAICEPLLKEVFGFHALAVEDALVEAHIPKLDEWDNYLYLVLHDIMFDEGRFWEARFPELDVFLGANYLVTHHQRPIPALTRVWQGILKDERLQSSGPDRVLFRLSHELLFDHGAVIDQVEEIVSGIEDRVFDMPAPDIPESLFTLKRMLLQMRRVIGPQREVFNKLALDRLPGIDARDRVYFRDVHDQAERLYDLLESQRDLVSGTLDTYLSMVNNRMNDTMKLLTTITTLFMPLSFITGFFGMNFFQSVGVANRWTETLAFDLSLVGMVIIPLGMYAWMRWRRLV